MIGAMHGAAVIPHQDITRLPAVAVGELRLSCVINQLVQQGIALLQWQIADLMHPVRVDIERLLPGDRVCADQWMENRRCQGFFFRCAGGDLAEVTA